MLLIRPRVLGRSRGLMIAMAMLLLLLLLMKMLIDGISKTVFIR